MSIRKLLRKCCNLKITTSTQNDTKGESIEELSPRNTIKIPPNRIVKTTPPHKAFFKIPSKICCTYNKNNYHNKSNTIRNINHSHLEKKTRALTFGITFLFQEVRSLNFFSREETCNKQNRQKLVKEKKLPEQYQYGPED